MRCKFGTFSNKSTVSIDALGRGGGLLEYSSNLDEYVSLAASTRSRVLSHLACMYFCLRHGPMCIFLSFMHFLAALHKILINDSNLAILPMNTSGKIFTSRLYSSHARVISNSARKFSSMITLTSPFLGFDESITSMNVCSPVI